MPVRPTTININITHSNMEIFDTPQKEQCPEVRKEVEQQQQLEYKLIGKQRRRPGHTVFSLNVKTGEIKPAPMICDVVITMSGKTEKRRINIEPDCIYRQALNKKNFVKILVREGILRQRPGD